MVFFIKEQVNPREGIEWASMKLARTDLFWFPATQNDPVVFDISCILLFLSTDTCLAATTMTPMWLPHSLKITPQLKSQSTWHRDQCD